MLCVVRLIQFTPRMRNFCTPNTELLTGLAYFGTLPLVYHRDICTLFSLLPSPGFLRTSLNETQRTNFNSPGVPFMDSNDDHWYFFSLNEVKKTHTSTLYIKHVLLKSPLK